MPKTAKERLNTYLALLSLLDIADCFVLEVQEDNVVLKDYINKGKIDKLHLPRGVDIIKDACFSGSPITEAHLPKGIKYIGESCFANCNQLKKIYIHEESLQFKEHLTRFCRAELIVKKPKT